VCQNCVTMKFILNIFDDDDDGDDGMVAAGVFSQVVISFCFLHLHSRIVFIIKMERARENSERQRTFHGRAIIESYGEGGWRRLSFVSL
jgi:hypothetical protein